jgi:uncharacterized protein YqeY
LKNQALKEKRKRLLNAVKACAATVADPSLSERLGEDLKTAMRDGDAVRRSAIRLIRAAIKNAEIAQRKTLDDEGVIDILAREVRQRKESITEFEKADRSDLVSKEQSELEIVLNYLPQQMSAEDIAAEARKVIEQMGARGPADKGKVMSVLAPALRGKADGREINEAVTKLLER